MDDMFMFRLAKAISDKGITRAELSRLSGVGKSDITYYIQGRYAPKQDKCYMLAKALDVDPGWLMTGIKPDEEHYDTNEVREALSELENSGAMDIADLYLSLNEENRAAAKKYMEYLKSQEVDE